MHLYLLFLIPLLVEPNSLEDDCRFIITYSNGSRTLCIDRRCSSHLDLIAIEDHQCRTNSLSLTFSTYHKYEQFLNRSSSRIPLSSFFSMDHPKGDRLLQIHFLSPLDNSRPFQFDQFRLLSGPNSHIDTYEMIFHGKISKMNSILYLDRDFFLSNEQRFIQTLRLRFHCTFNKTVQWELRKSNRSLPPSPCEEQIQYFPKQQTSEQFKCFHFNFLVKFSFFLY